MNFFPALVTEEHPLEIREILPTETLGLDAANARVEHLFEAPHPNCIDLTPLIREDILLELPLNAVCRLGTDGRCPVTGELYQPPPETSGTLAGEEVWEALKKIKTKD